MTKLFNAIKDIAEAAISNDGTKLGTSVVSIVENGISIVSEIFGN
ncbi:beta-class phenol-soluble modulin [Staphylococcus saccharolyticus]|uniref:Hemolytic protein n=1 Tax=Staphylococcus saccharolyticus TaxID=33028 RepID=A0A380H735_9STAP|nr:beta-class phenol-soluble modulin [Staphylococcus saccharolyticus]MBL7565486.1 beta-class phenol-soluble modulin [Staphylococcus saccharolyticus]MBL7571457.1 beta-class phenol-soluble modulin [Staphylococcus saccharolyticus]QQB97975.1 beta-class phenol-soluble modulin [Staphylococcus saccharolyticus]QRJ66170.1 beta-class phenol-soluble modulin [Staphylococcus saccharolyticus]RTX96062.1 beta-class phenol-soluble modulin [Staphylococcus saccharolyticus]